MNDAVCRAHRLNARAMEATAPTSPPARRDTNVSSHGRCSRGDRRGNIDQGEQLRQGENDQRPDDRAEQRACATEDDHGQQEDRGVQVERRRIDDFRSFMRAAGLKTRRGIGKRPRAIETKPIARPGASLRNQACIIS